MAANGSENLHRIILQLGGNRRDTGDRHSRFNQTTGSFQYVIPHFNSNSGSEIILSNLSSVLASAKVTFRNSEQAQVADAGINIPAGAQLRLTAGSLALSSFDGTVIVVSSSRLSVIATL